MKTPHASDLQDAFMALAARDPGHPLLCLWDEPNERYRSVDPAILFEHAASLVTELPPEATVPSGSLAAGLLESSPYPLRILVGSDRIALASSHALGDDRSLTHLLIELLTSTRPALHQFPGRTSTASQLAVALAEYVHRPGRLVRAVADRQGAPGSPFQGDRSPAMPAGTILVQDVRIQREHVERLRAWRRERCPGVSMAALTSTLWFRALNGMGQAPEGFYLLVDTRRYGGARASHLWGNLAKSVYVRPASMVQPQHMATAVKQTLESTRPLAALTAQALRASATCRGQRLVQPPTTQVEYSLTHLRALSTSAGLPWLNDPTEVRCLLGLTPGGPLGVTVAFLTIGEALHVTVSMRNDNPEAVRIASGLEAMADPLSLLDGSR
ncbi:MAG: hypothetical protein LC808_09125 [Actinobacteria bacterium]|nr:hypothetical protein [Actinomycetota bacterium]